MSTAWDNSQAWAHGRIGCFTTGEGDPWRIQDQTVVPHIVVRFQDCSPHAEVRICCIKGFRRSACHRDSINLGPKFLEARTDQSQRSWRSVSRDPVEEMNNGRWRNGPSFLKRNKDEWPVEDAEPVRRPRKKDDKGHWCCQSYDAADWPTSLLKLDQTDPTHRLHCASWTTWKQAMTIEASTRGDRCSPTELRSPSAFGSWRRKETWETGRRSTVTWTHLWKTQSSGWEAD